MSDLTLIYDETNSPKRIYHIRTDSHGYPAFLIYHNGQWLYVSAKHFKPSYTNI